MTLETERRKENRKRPPNLVYVELASANGGMMRDICEEGFAVRAMMPLRIGDSTPFAFSVDASTRFEGSCRVLWVEEEGRVAGLKFTEVSPQLLEQVRVWLSQEGLPQGHQPMPSLAPARPVNTLEELRDELRGVSPRAEPRHTEISHAENLPSEISRAEPPRIEFPPMKIPRLEGATLQVPEAEDSPAEKASVSPLTPIQHVCEPQLLEEEREADAERSASCEPDLQSLRELASEPVNFEPLPELLGEHGDLESRGSAARLDPATVSLAVRILVFLALVAAAVVYHRELGSGLIWLGGKLSGAPATPDAQAPASAAPLQTAVPAATPPVVPPSADPAQTPSQSAEQKEVNPTLSTAETQKPSDTTTAAGNPPVATAKTTNPAAATPVPAANKPSGQKPFGEANSEAGQQEYLLAQEILKGKDREGRLTEVVRLLWTAVEKGNSSAEVSLADMYRRGQGVTKNCDQTRILLTAAARKGNAEAQRRLEAFLREGCE